MHAYNDFGGGWFILNEENLTEIHGLLRVRIRKIRFTYSKIFNLIRSIYWCWIWNRTTLQTFRVSKSRIRTTFLHRWLRSVATEIKFSEFFKIFKTWIFKWRLFSSDLFSQMIFRMTRVVSPLRSSSWCGHFVLRFLIPVVRIATIVVVYPYLIDLIIII